MNVLEALQRTRRLEELGLVVRSASLANEAREIVEFQKRGGNRAMRRQAAKATWRKRR